MSIHLPTCSANPTPPYSVVSGGIDARKGQLVRLIPYRNNRDAGKAWWGVCFDPAVAKITDNDAFRRMVEGAPQNLRRVAHDAKSPQGRLSTDITRNFAAVTVSYRPEWSFQFEKHEAPLDDGLWDNGCWPQGAVPDDPRFVLLDNDAVYNYGREPTRWNYESLTCLDITVSSRETQPLLQQREDEGYRNRGSGSRPKAPTQSHRA